MTPAHILYPSLAKDPQIIPKLEILLEDMSNPTLDAAVIWAEKLGRSVKAVDILTYARLRYTQQGNTNPNTASVPTVSQFPHLPPFQRSLPLRPPSPPQRPRSQLPTPASSTSPEPRSPAIDGRFKLVPARPAEEEEDDDEDMKDELEMDDEEMDVEEEPMSRPTYEIHLDERRLNDLATSLHAVLSQPPGPPPSGNVPKTYADLSRWLGRESQASIELLNSIERGVYAPLGLDLSTSHPSMAK
ncbi:hypothetical protein C8Q74DRAFT_1294420 [Fomes fomentarius]|nr:hypothetical protein C8Q74DRAFT_1294420 [Fomes fomentarius]